MTHDRGHLADVTGRVQAALDRAVETVARNATDFRGFPDDTTTDGRYLPRPAAGAVPEGGNHGWTTSFWVGMQWIAWEVGGDPAVREAAAAGTADFVRRVREGEDLDMHDLGFLYSLSCVASHRLTGDATAADAAVAAAEHLTGRFLEPAGIVQAWGDLSDPEHRGHTIIDSLLNMPLLTWAGARTGRRRFDEVVRRHCEQLARHIVRDDDSTFHTFGWDEETGAPLGGGTAQGASPTSCWARGQAWGIYGFALNASAVGSAELLDASRRCADYFLDHLPEDLVPYWDLDYRDGSAAPRDSSAAAIAVCGLYELAAQLDDGERYRAAGEAILDSLIRGYTADTATGADPLLLHGVYDMPGGIGVDEGTLWGDYFYLEALRRSSDPSWRPYW